MFIDVLCDSTRRSVHVPAPSGWTAPVGSIGAAGGYWTAATVAHSLSLLHCVPSRAWASYPTSYRATTPRNVGTGRRPRPPYRD